MVYTETRIILKFEDDVDGKEKAYVDLDGPSGGYPCAAINVLNAHNFKTEEAALKYASMFTTYPLKIRQHPIKITIVVHD